MATPSTEPPRPSWSELVANARGSRPADVDVRANVRRTILALPPEIVEMGVFADLADLARSAWLKGSLASAAVGAVVLGWNLIQPASDAFFLIALHGEFAF